MVYDGSMKDVLTKGVRKVFPKRAVHGIENLYRKGRVQTVSARYGYPAKGMSVIAVTGTNGKTTTVNYLNEIFKAAGKTTALFSTAVIEIAGERYINDLNRTVPLTKELQKFFVKAKRAHVDHVILETTSHALDQYKLATIPIECAVMTNLTQDHLDYHGTMENYAAAKGKLFDGLPRFVVLNRDDAWFSYFDRYDASESKMTYGAEPTSDCRITRVKLFKKGSEAELVFDTQTHLELATALPGKFNVYNLAAAATVAYLYHLPLEAIVEGIANLEAVPGRFERVDVDKPYDVIVDYAHTPDSLEKFLEAVKGMTKNRVILVFGACGDRDKSKRPIMGKIAAQLADRIFLTDEESYNEDPDEIRDMLMSGITSGGGEPKTEEIPDRRDAIAKALSVARTGDSVVITGMGHEQYRIVNGKKIPWNDSAVVRELLDKKPVDKDTP